MRTLRTAKNLSVIVFAILLMSSVVLAEPMTYSGKHDIGEMMTIAEQSFDLSKQDAVILLEGEKRYLLPDGRQRTLFHEIVWINTEYGLDNYADLRVPFDSERTTLAVLSLRTWREGQWWQGDTTDNNANNTAIVETLPFAIRTADAYNHMRETMLLHDGVELPCIMETAYVVEDKQPFRKNIEGIWYFQHNDPVVWSWFVLGFPHGYKPLLSHPGNVGEPVKGKDGELDTYSFKKGPSPAISSPQTADPAPYTPHIAWSTWSSWKNFGDYIKSTISQAMVLDEALKDSVSKLTKYAPIAAEKADNIVEFVSDYTREVNYPWEFWKHVPRKAHDVFSSAYGHRLDRAVLAAALFAEAGFTVSPIFRSSEHINITDYVPTLDRFDGVALWISGDGVEAYYNPSNSTIHNGLNQIFGRTIWLPGVEDKPNMRWSGKGESSKYELCLEVNVDTEEANINGKGFYSVSGGFCSYEDMEGTGNQAENHLESVVSGVLTGAGIDSYNPVVFDRFNVTMGLDYSAGLSEEDDYGRYIIEIGNPADGIIDRLPGDVHLNEDSRNSPVNLPGMSNQIVRVILNKCEKYDVYRIPETFILENSAGKFSVNVEEKCNKIIITREISLAETSFTADGWTDLRSLLLAETNERHRTVMIKF